MKRKPQSLAVTQHRMRSTFESLAGKLLAERSAAQLNRPLAWWALANDRRLPLAFLGRPVRKLLQTPFDELNATQGVGVTKMHTLLELLARVAREPAQEGLAESSPASNGRVAMGLGELDPLGVSETTWASWRAAVRRHGMERLPIGRFAPTLADLPRAMWEAPLGEYTGMTLADIRALKTHGAKRVNGVIRVFAAVNLALGNGQAPPHLEVRLMSRLAAGLESWSRSALAATRLPAQADVRRNLAEPILAQVRVDGGDELSKLTQGRMGLRPGEESVRQVSRRLRITRARVYQLLDDVSAMLLIRWPEADQLLRPLNNRFQAEAGHSSEARLVHAAAELFLIEPRDAVARAAGTEATPKEGRGSDAASRREAG